MTDVLAALETAFESAGYEVDQTSNNRGTVRVDVRGDDADAGELRELTEEVCGEDAVLGFDVTHETTGDDEVGTVVSFRHRP